MCRLKLEPVSPKSNIRHRCSFWKAHGARGGALRRPMTLLLYLPYLDVSRPHVGFVLRISHLNRKASFSRRKLRVSGLRASSRLMQVRLGRRKLDAPVLYNLIPEVSVTQSSRTSKSTRRERPCSSNVTR
jgi:hypothetical protein